MAHDNVSDWKAVQRSFLAPSALSSRYPLIRLQKQNQVPAEDDPAPPDTLYAGVEYECMWQVKNVTLYKQVSAKWALSH